MSTTRRSRHSCDHSGPHMQGRPLQRPLSGGHILVLCILPCALSYWLLSPLSITSAKRLRSPRADGPKIENCIGLEPRLEPMVHDSMPSHADQLVRLRIGCGVLRRGRG
jgi:hypothetical protein